MTLRLASLLSLILVFAGCGGDDGDDEGGSSGASMSGGDDTPTEGDPVAADVCAAACAKFAQCGSEDPSCEDDCVAGIEFIAMNNPETQCGSYEAGRQNCLAGLTCEEIDVYLDSPNDPNRPCKVWVERESMCAIE